jgi:WD40 repeat protein
MSTKLGIRSFLVVVTTVGLVALSATPALALTETPDLGTSRTTGKVLALAQHGDTIYMGGHFLSVFEPNGKRQDVSNIAAFDRTTGAWIPTWTASVTNTSSTAQATVEELAVSEDGQWLYVGGKFDTVNGQPANNLAAVDTATGTVVDPNFLPKVSQIVRTILVGGGRVYIGGNFKKVNGQTRNRLAAFASDGTLDPYWIPSASHSSSTHSSAVHALEWASDGQTIFVGGAFDRMNGQTRTSVARVTPDTGALDLWAIPSNQVGTNVAWDLLATPTRLYAGFGDGPNWAGAYRLDSGFLGSQVWRNNYVGNIQSLALSPSGTRLFLAGHNGTARLQQTVCGKNIRGLLMVDPVNGATDCSWIPQIEPYGNNYLGAWIFLRSDGQLWVGGKFTHISGVKQGAFARYTL